MSTTVITTCRIGRKGGCSLEQARVVYLCKHQGMSYTEAYYKAFPHRKPTRKVASWMGSQIYWEYRENHLEDLKETAKRHGIDEDAYFEDLSRLRRAKTFDEKVESHIGEDGKAVTLRNSIVVADNGIRLGAVKEIGRALGIGPQPGESGGTQQNVFVYVEGQVHKTRQKRYVGGNGHGEGKRRGAD